MSNRQDLKGSPAVRSHAARRHPSSNLKYSNEFVIAIRVVEPPPIVMRAPASGWPVADTARPAMATIAVVAAGIAFWD